MKRDFILLILFLTALTFFLFFPFFTQLQHPFPGDFLMAWYEPWKSNTSTDSFISISHKPVADDIFRQLYPFKVLAISLLQQFQLPLWNPYNGAGMPLLATMHVGYLNPFNIVFFFLSRELAWSFQVIIQPFLIGLFLYLFCRRVGISTIGSVFAVASFVLSGFVVVRTIYADYNFAVAGLIILLYALESFIQNHKKTVFLIPFSVFLIVTSTQPQMIIYLLGFFFLYLLFRVYQKKIERPSLYFVVFLTLLGVGLTAVQLLPTLELLFYSNITTESSRFIIERFLLPPQHFISLLIPNYFGNQSTYNYWGSADFIETIATLGTIPVFFALLSLSVPPDKKKLIYFFFPSFFVGIFLSLDTFFTRFLYSLPFPVLSTSIPSRILVISLLSLSILGGFGVDIWLRKKTTLWETFKKTSPLLIVLLTLCTGTIYFYLNNITCNNQFVLNCRTIALRNSLLELSIFALFIITFFVSYLYSKEKILKASALFTIFLITAIGLYNAYKFLPFTEKNRILPATELIGGIKNYQENNRTFGFGKATIKTNFATFFSFYDPNYYDPLYIKRYAELISYANSGTLNALSRSDIEIASDVSLKQAEQDRRMRLLNLLSVRQFIYAKTDSNTLEAKKIYEDKNWILAENSHSLPRVYLVDNLITAKDTKILDILFDPSFDITTSAVVDENVNISTSSLPPGSASITKYSENNIQIAIQTQENALLVLTDNFYPGWKAYINDRETKILRVNYTFRGVVVPPGSHTIRFVYNPFSVKLGIIISLFSLVLYLGIILFREKIAGYKKNR